MRLISTLAIAAALAAAQPLAAQEAATAYDPAQVVTLEGMTETVIWSMTEGTLELRPADGGPLWDIALPNTRTLLDNGLSADVFARGAAVKVRAYRSTDKACNPKCRARAIEIILSRDGAAHALLSPAPATAR